MFIERRREDLNIRTGEQQLKQSENFSYLEVSINERKGQEMEINQKIANYNASASMLHLILKDKNVPREYEIINWNTILKLLLTYASECWTQTTKIKSKVLAVEMRVLRLIRRVTRRDRMSNDGIREPGIKSLLEKVEGSKLRGYGYIKRMRENR